MSANMRAQYLKYLELKEADELLNFTVEHPDGSQGQIQVDKEFKKGSRDLRDEEYRRFTLRPFDFQTPQSLLFDLGGGIGDMVMALETIRTLQREVASQSAAEFEFVGVLPQGKLKKFGRFLRALAIFDCLVPSEQRAQWQPRYQTLYMRARPDGVRPAYICMGSYWQLLWASWGIPGKCEHPEDLIGCGNMEELLASEYQSLAPKLDLPPSKEFVLFSPEGNTQRPHRFWPVEYWVALTKEAAADQDQRILVNSSNAAYDEYFKDLPNVTRFNRAVDVVGLASLVHSARCTVSVDSGPVHLSGTFRTPCINLVGPTAPVIHGHRNNINLRVSSCPPCYGRQRAKLCIDNVCMKEIRPDIVLELLRRALRGIYHP